MAEKKIEKVVLKQPSLKSEKVAEVATGFIVSVKKEYVLKWSSKAMTKDAKKAKVFAKDSADYIAKELEGKVIPV